MLLNWVLTQTALFEPSLENPVTRIVLIWKLVAASRKWIRLLSHCTVQTKQIHKQKQFKPAWAPSTYCAQCWWPAWISSSRVKVLSGINAGKSRLVNDFSYLFDRLVLKLLGNGLDYGERGDVEPSSQHKSHHLILCWL